MTWYSRCFFLKGRDGRFSARQVVVLDHKLVKVNSNDSPDPAQIWRLCLLALCAPSLFVKKNSNTVVEREKYCFPEAVTKGRVRHPTVCFFRQGTVAGRLCWTGVKNTWCVVRSLNLVPLCLLLLPLFCLQIYFAHNQSHSAVVFRLFFLPQTHKNVRTVQTKVVAIKGIGVPTLNRKNKNHRTLPKNKPAILEQTKHQSKEQQRTL